jgi:murein hydrolase activator
MFRIAKIEIALFFSAFTVIAVAQSTLDSDQAETELQAVGSAIAEIQSWLNDANKTASSEEATLAKATQELSIVARSIESLERNMQQQNNELSALRAQAAVLQDQKETQARSAASVIRAVYKRGTASPLKTLLSQGGLNRDARMRYYARTVSTQQLAKIDEFELTLAAITENETALAAGLAQLEQQQQELTTQQSALLAARDDQAAALEKFRGRIKSRADELEQLEFSQAELQRLIEEIRQTMEGIRSFEDVPLFSSAKGKLPLPVAGTIISRFGQQYGNGSLVRQGITLSVEPGTSVQAVHAGHVVFADWLRGSGLLVIIDHGNGFMSLYGGNESLSAAPGQWVDVGEIVATSGVSASNGEPSLYFEIRQRGQPQDPTSWLALD